MAAKCGAQCRIHSAVTAFCERGVEGAFCRSVTGSGTTRREHVNDGLVRGGVEICVGVELGRAGSQKGGRVRRSPPEKADVPGVEALHAGPSRQRHPPPPPLVGQLQHQRGGGIFRWVFLGQPAGPACVLGDAVNGSSAQGHGRPQGDGGRKTPRENHTSWKWRLPSSTCLTGSSSATAPATLATTNSWQNSVVPMGKPSTLQPASWSWRLARAGKASRALA
eukprot:619884-Rhodomonas_salina.1